MREVDLLKLEADESFKALLVSLDGITEHQAWGVMPCREGEYLHTEGSILSIIVHVASCKVMYASAAYRGLEYRWTDMIRRMESFWPSLNGAMVWLHEAQAYWLSSWAEETDPERPVKTNWNETWPNWRVIWTVSHHDGYHAGQIQMLRSMVDPCSTAPPIESAEWLKYAHEYSR